METDDELIGEFMGIEPHDGTDPRELHYKTDWNRLIDVWEKIEYLPLSGYEYHQRVLKIRFAVESLDIEVVYKAIVEFVRWYKTQE